MLKPVIRPWHAVPQYAVVQLYSPCPWDDGTRTVIDPRTAKSTVVLRHEPTGRISVDTVNPNATVVCLEPVDIANAIDNLRKHFDVSTIDGQAED